MTTVYLIVNDTAIPTTLGDLKLQIAQKKLSGLSNYDVGIADDLDILMLNQREKIIDYFSENGFADFIAIDSLNESVVRAGQSQNTIVRVLHKYLQKLQITSELIIVDPFFFATPKNADYSDFITDIFRPFLAGIDTIRFVVTDNNSKVNAGIKTDIETKFKAVNPTLVMHCTYTGDFHDRYIFSNNRSKGVVVGTSFNGLGNKLALIDRLNVTDVREIISELSLAGLI